MMTVTTTNGRTFKVIFMHSVPPQNEPRETKNETRRVLDVEAKELDRRITLCTIDELDAQNQGVTIGSGVALCHPTDQFNKATGRKLSFTYALEAAGLTRDERGELWAAYLDK